MVFTNYTEKNYPNCIIREENQNAVRAATAKDVSDFCAETDFNNNYDVFLSFTVNETSLCDPLLVLRLQWASFIGCIKSAIIIAFGLFLLHPFFFAFLFFISFFVLLLRERSSTWALLACDMTNDIIVLSRCLTMNILPGIGRRIIVHYSMHIFQRRERETRD